MAAILQPSDLSQEYPIKTNYGNYVNFSIEYLVSHNVAWNFILISDGNQGYWIIGLEEDVADVYIYDSNYIHYSGTSYSNSAWSNLQFHSDLNNKLIRYNETSGTFETFGSTVNLSISQWDGKYIYCYPQSTNVQQVIYISAYTNLYINDVKQYSYTWESIPRITGKGTTYRLTDILNINDGEAVNDVSPSGNVDFSAKTKVNNLIADAIVSMDYDKVLVLYIIPSNNYQYIKLVYKKGSIPTSDSDGTAFTITQSSTSKEIDLENFDEGKTYYFVIFTDLSISDAYPFEFTEPVLAKVESAKTVLYAEAYNVSGYSAKRIVIKEGSEPENSNDGTVYAISGENPLRITGVSTNKIYYCRLFVRKTNDSVWEGKNTVIAKTAQSALTLLDSDSGYINSDLLDYSLYDQNSGSQYEYKYNSTNKYFYKDCTLDHNGHSNIFFNKYIDTDGYKYICVDAEVISGNTPKAEDNHYNSLSATILRQSDGDPVYDSVKSAITNGYRRVNMVSYASKKPGGSSTFVTTGKLNRYIIKIDISDIPSTNIRLNIESCDNTNRIYGVWLEK